jgi:hypothetical protein
MKMGKHSWLMMIGCAIPIVGIVLLPLFGVKLGGILPLLFLMVCPLSMVFMMGAMGKGHNHSGHDDGHSEAEHEHFHSVNTVHDSEPMARTLPSTQEREQNV